MQALYAELTSIQWFVMLMNVVLNQFMYMTTRQLSLSPYRIQEQIKVRKDEDVQWAKTPDMDIKQN